MLSSGDRSGSVSRSTDDAPRSPTNRNCPSSEIPIRSGSLPIQVEAVSSPVNGSSVVMAFGFTSDRLGTET